MRRGWGSEKALADFLEYRFKRLGLSGSAYIPVVAGGRNALTIHYVRNDAIFGDGDTVLVDAGGEYGGYVADITRTFPTWHKARFSEAQRELYEAVLGVQRRCVAGCTVKRGVSLDGLHGMAEEGLREALKGLGFDVRGRNMEVLFPHHVGHYVGLDVHDTPGWSRRDTLQAGQAVTVEPGVYVPDDDRWPERFRGVGVRIEDCVVVGSEDPLVLTAEAPKEVVDIEALKEEGLELEKVQDMR
jgi:intermediate cleaving peptidase 55